MQEDLEQRTVTLVINSSKFTGRTLMKGIKGFLGFIKNQAQKHKNVKPQGKQSVKKLIGQNQGVSEAELGADQDIRTFQRVAKKYGVDYAVKRVEMDGKPKFLVFFKARDADAITSAMNECVDIWDKRSKEDRPSVRKTIAYLRSVIAGKDNDRAKSKEISR